VEVGGSIPTPELNTLGSSMRDLREELRTAEERYFMGVLASLFLSGLTLGGLVAWLLWH